VIGHAEVAIEDVELERQHNLPPDHPIMQETKKQLEQDLAKQKDKKSKQLAARAGLQARKQKRQGRQLGSTGGSQLCDYLCLMKTCCSPELTAATAELLMIC